MYKRLLLIALAILLMGGIANAGTTYTPSYENCIVIDGTGTSSQPPCFIKKVRYAKMGSSKTAPSLASGDVVKWDVVSADGVTISACTAEGDVPCGVLVTAALTDDSAGFSEADNFAYMAVSGRVLAKIDVSGATDGQKLVYLGTAGPAFVTNDLGGTSTASRDCGVLLSEPSSDGVGTVWLNLQ